MAYGETIDFQNADSVATISEDGTVEFLTEFAGQALDYTEIIYEVTEDCLSVSFCDLVPTLKTEENDFAYVDWGDGETEKIFNGNGPFAHEYASAGTYVVRISNNVRTFNAVSGNSDRPQYGSDFELTRFASNISVIGEACFRECSSIKRLPVLSNLSFDLNVFRDCDFSKLYEAGYDVSVLNPVFVDNTSTTDTKYTGEAMFAGSNVRRCDITTWKSVPGGCFNGCALLSSVDGEDY